MIALRDIPTFSVSYEEPSLSVKLEGKEVHVVALKENPSIADLLDQVEPLKDKIPMMARMFLASKQLPPRFNLTVEKAGEGICANFNATSPGKQTISYTKTLDNATDFLEVLDWLQKARQAFG